MTRENDMTVSETFGSAEDLAKFSIGKTGVVFVVGTRNDCDSLVERLEGLVLVTERIVHIEPDARIFETMDGPKELPAIGIWSAKGSLVGYREHDESIEAFLEYARRLCCGTKKRQACDP